MKFYFLLITVFFRPFLAEAQVVLDSNMLILMTYGDEFAYIDSQAVQPISLSVKEIEMVNSLMIDITIYYNIQVTRGSLSLKEKHLMDSLSHLEADLQIVHKRKDKYKKRKIEAFSQMRQAQIKTFSANRDSLYQIMLSLYTKSMPDRNQQVVQYAGMGSNVIILTLYDRQYMPYLNEEGQRMVYVVCQSDYRMQVKEHPILREEYSNKFFSCGDCYEGLLYAYINLDDQEVAKFMTN